MKLKSVRGKNNVQRVYREYEIDTGAIEALNSIEKRTAVETGQTSPGRFRPLALGSGQSRFGPLDD
jgi:hypothetical protein